MQSKMDEALSEDIKEDIREAYKSIQRNVKGFRDRKAQLKLIAEVARTLSGFYGSNRTLAVEAPTGTGKSIGYMLGAIPVAKSYEKRLIISTGTVALQEQLVKRDIPALRSTSGLEFSFVLAKGRGRYACNRNVSELTNNDARQSDMLGDDGINTAAWSFVPDNEQIKLVNAMEDALNHEEWSGDLDEWKGAEIDDKLRPLIVTDHGGCMGRNCSHFYQCGFHNTRQKMREADVIVANHDLVMSDINLGGGAILPAPEDSIYVFDEAHHLPDVALSHQSAEVNLKRSLETITKSPKVISEALSALKTPPDLAKKILEEVKGSVAYLEEAINDSEIYLAEAFPEAQSATKRPGWQSRSGAVSEVWRFQNGIQPAELVSLAGVIDTPVKVLLATLSGSLEKMREAFRKKEIDANIATKIGRNLNFHKQRISNIQSTWQLMGVLDLPGSPPTARWITREKPHRGGKIEYTVSCCPTSASQRLRERLWSKAFGVVLASATLTALGRFNRFAERAGLGTRDGTQYLALPSPFDHAQNGELYIPDMTCDPSNPEKHTQEVIKLLNHLIVPELGTLVLFSARKQMREVAEKLSDNLKSQLLLQGDRSKNEILELHRERIGKGQGSIIFGLASFSEGVDLPGRLCESVFIAKLPFAVPDSPIDATYSEWLESVGRNPFMEISVPDACTKLIQACGRLIRTETDQGRITLLDSRILTKRYGPQMLNSLPPFRRLVDNVREIA
ncbi:MAG: ATP-dependent DNA helicase DinG [Halomonadaceae bacterium]|nr:ATP-dependent DNA helicase DinG [Halomonadaceae bacterium]